MATERNVQIGVRFLAVILIGAAATLSAHARSHHAHYAKHSDSRPDSAAGNVRGTKIDDHAPGETGPASKPRAFKVPDNSVTQDNSGSKQAGGKLGIKGAAAGAKGDGVKVPTGEGAVAKDGNSIDWRASDMKVIDTRITVQSRRPGGRRGNVRAVKTIFKIRSPGNFHARRTPALGAFNFVARNAIGLPVPRTSAAGKRDAVKVIERSVVDGTPKSGNTAANGDVGGGGADLRRHRLVPLPAGGGSPHDPPIIRAMNDSIVDGRDFVRRGSGSSMIGGQTKNTVGALNGTGFRPRHL